MLDPAERQHFDKIVTHLRSQDPRFVRRIETLRGTERRDRVLWALLLWTVPPLLIIFGGRLGVLLGMIVCIAGAYVLLWRRGGGSGRIRGYQGVP